MNYLGHLFFSDNNPELMYANLFGDFVKGKNYTHYPEYIQKGIRLHRAIDDFIDNHSAVVELMHKLYPSLPKIAGIAVDLYFDHLLAKHWNDYHSQPITEYLQSFETTKVHRADFDKVFFWVVIDKMKEGRWLHHYQSMEGLTKACQGLSRRISFDNKLHEAPKVFTEMEESIERAFRIYMDDAIPYFEALRNELRI